MPSPGVALRPWFFAAAPGIFPMFPGLNVKIVTPAHPFGRPGRSPPEETVFPMTATATHATFRLDCRVRCHIEAPPERIWALLTDAGAFPRWNSTVTEISGKIALGERLSIKVPSAPGRTFRPSVTLLEPSRVMEWSDGMAPMFKGVRRFTLTPDPKGGTEFEMHEAFAGLMLPMIKGSLPDFVPVFDAYAADLKRAAEASAV
jgi:uncharacterized protein YndB with AHSA1/START domain